MLSACFVGVRCAYHRNNLSMISCSFVFLSGTHEIHCRCKWMIPCNLMGIGLQLGRGSDGETAWVLTVVTRQSINWWVGTQSLSQSN